MLRSFSLAWIALLLVSALAQVALGDGLIIIDRPPHPVVGHFPFAPMEVAYHRVTVSIDDQVAITSVDQEFRNTSGARLEGTYMFPLPDGAAIDKFSMDIDGREMEAELLPADKARAIYEDIVRRHKDPALLEYVGKGAFKVRIFPIEPHSTKRVRLKYTQLLKSDAGLVEYIYPLNTEKFSSRPLKDVSVKVDLTCNRAIKSVYSPSHDVEIRRRGQRRATVGYEERNARPDTDFKLIFSRSDDPVGLDLLTYRTSPDEGYFLLLASPGINDAGETVQNRDICFVLDTSGSMAGPKMEQAKRALMFCLANLNAGDRFEIVRFSTEAEPLFDGLKAASKENIDQAQEFVQSLKPIGGTAIADALGTARRIGNERAGNHDDDDRPYVIIFLTDGQPTIGETKEDAIVSAQTKSQRTTPRIFSFGIGADVNTHLLDRIANQTRAFSQYVLPTEDIEVKVSSFYTKIQSPVLTDLKLIVADRICGPNRPSISQVYPPHLPDLYAGQTLMIFGRYRGEGSSNILLTGTANGKAKHFKTAVDFPHEIRTHAFIPRLWATRRVGWLLDEIRLHGESKELKDEVVSLAREHGIVTPYTAYLILEDEARRGVPIAQRSFRELESDAPALRVAREQWDSARAGSDALEKFGDRAVANSANVGSLKTGANVQQAQQSLALDKAAAPAGATTTASGASGYRSPQNYAQQVRVARGKTFYQNGNTWSDADVASRQNLKNQQVAFNSEDYFALLRAHPDAASWLSLGNEVDVVIGDTLYQIR